jgi:O-antigen ligase
MLNAQSILKFQNWSLMAISFCIPLVPKLVPVLLFIFASLSITALIKGYRRVEITEVGILLIGLYVLHVIGMLFTKNVDRGLFDLEVKLSLLALPISFIGYGNLDKVHYEKILRAFLIGITLAAVFCLVQSAYKVFVLNAKYFYFLSSRFSVIIHQSYFAMYLVFGIAILTYLEWPVFRRISPLRTFASISLMLFLSICTILTGSKIGFIMWVIVMVAITVFLIKELKQKWMPAVMLMGFMSVGLAFIQSTPELKSRILKVIRLTDGQLKEDATGNIESTAARLLVYKTVGDVLIDQPWYGSGTGDFQDVLDIAYEAKGYSNLKERHLNAHNQFFQSWLGLGIPGLVLLFSIFVVIFQHAFSSGERVYLGFAALIALISLTESMLNVQAGVVFFSFFVMLFSRHTLPKG